MSLTLEKYSLVTIFSLRFILLLARRCPAFLARSALVVPGADNSVLKFHHQLENASTEKGLASKSSCFADRGFSRPLSAPEPLPRFTAVLFPPAPSTQTPPRPRRKPFFDSPGRDRHGTARHDDSCLWWPAWIG